MPAPRHVTASGTHYAREGEGPALLFIHGAGGNAAAWFQQVEAFARDYCVMCIDLPGFGQTLPRQLANTTESLAHVVLEVLDHAGFESASLIGQSLGGWFALRAALAAPERIERLTLSCTMAGIAHPPAFAAFTAAMAKMGSSGVGAFTLTPAFRASQGNKAYPFTPNTFVTAQAADIAPPGLVPANVGVVIGAPLQLCVLKGICRYRSSDRNSTVEAPLAA